MSSMSSTEKLAACMHKVIEAHALEATPTTSSTCTHLGSAMTAKSNILAKELSCPKVQFLQTCTPLAFTSNLPKTPPDHFFFLLQDAMAKVTESSYQTITKIDLLTQVNKLSCPCTYMWEVVQTYRTRNSHTYINT